MVEGALDDNVASRVWEGVAYSVYCILCEKVQIGIVLRLFLYPSFCTFLATQINSPTIIDATNLILEAIR